MNIPTGTVFQSRVDDFSYQVSTPSDKKFWFRLVREENQDVITDFFIGSFSREYSGPLLAECYRTLKMSPQNIIVFRDLLSGRPISAQLLAEAQELYVEAGKTLLTAFGAKNIDCRTEHSKGKVHLVIAGRVS
jgi:hypothetical protein